MIEALDRVASSIEARKAAMDTFRADFKTVFDYWIGTQQETPDVRDECAQSIRDHSHDADWMECAAKHFAGLAERVRARIERDEQIKREVNERKEMMQ